MLLLIESLTAVFLVGAPADAVRPVAVQTVYRMCAPRNIAGEHAGFKCFSSAEDVTMMQIDVGEARGRR